jgi:hypothetical protein
MAGDGRARVTSAPEASGCLVAPPVFKTGEPCTARLAASIPVRLRVDPARNGHRPVIGLARLCCAIQSATCSPIMMQVRLMFAREMAGMSNASATRRSRRCGAGNAGRPLPSGRGRPIRAVPRGWNWVATVARTWAASALSDLIVSPVSRCLRQFLPKPFRRARRRRVPPGQPPGHVWRHLIGKPSPAGPDPPTRGHQRPDADLRWCRRPLLDSHGRGKCCEPPAKRCACVCPGSGHIAPLFEAAPAVVDLLTAF